MKSSSGYIFKSYSHTLCCFNIYNFILFLKLFIILYLRVKRDIVVDRRYQRYILQSKSSQCMNNFKTDLPFNKSTFIK